MALKLFDHQKRAVEMLKTGSILQGGVGSGKTLTALAYFVTKECGGSLQINNESGWAPMKNPKKLVVITTAKNRDDKYWEHSAIPFLINDMVVDSWNNLHKYTNIRNAFFVFDEQRLVGSGLWVKSFLKIAQSNHWILLSATPGDTWIDYIPVFIANGFYKNRTEFLHRHVVYKRWSKFPSVDHYVEVGRLIKLRDSIVIPMRFNRKTVSHDISVLCPFDKVSFDMAKIKRWNIFTNEPIKDVGELCRVMQKIVNSDESRLDEFYRIYKEHRKVVLFYNFNYELEALRKFCKDCQIPFTEWNGHKHEKILDGKHFVYLVQYTAGCEGWNCITTNCMVFFSQNYSYKVMTQAAGRIDRLNTPFTDLYYYHFLSHSLIDLAIQRALKNKQNFNERNYMLV